MPVYREIRRVIIASEDNAISFTRPSNKTWLFCYSCFIHSRIAMVVRVTLSINGVYIYIIVWSKKIRVTADYSVSLHVLRNKEKGLIGTASCEGRQSISSSFCVCPLDPGCLKYRYLDCRYPRSWCYRYRG